MKLSLPVALVKMLMVACAVVYSTVESATLNSDISLITYTDFGQNLGRYKTDETANALLLHLREQEGGVKIVYRNGESYTLDYNMPDFTGAKDHTATDMALGYNAIVTVKHNGVFNGSFTSSSIGADHGVFYQGIEYHDDSTLSFLHAPKSGFDHKVTRLSKVVTDVQTATLFSGTSEDLSNYMKVGDYVYRAGSGIMRLYDTETKTTSSLASYYVYVTGGIDRIDKLVESGPEVTIITNPAYNGKEFVPAEEPLPFGINSGDSGSPTFIYNKEMGRYEFIASASNGNGGESWHKGSIDFIRAQQSQYDKVVTATEGSAELHISKVSTPGETLAGGSSQKEVKTTPYSGWVTDAAGNHLKSFVGVRSGISTWSDLSALKDTADWYAYGNEYLNATPYAEEKKELIYADLFMTDNLVFEARTDRSKIVLDDTVDLGIGYAQFILGEGQGRARYDLSSGGDGSFQFNHAGYVIAEGVEVHTSLTGSADHMYEWRKVGEGDLHIEGKGKNDILLNVGGSGKTYLNRQDGYAAYNVLANTNSMVIISDTGQIARDFTFGHEGGVLDMHGNSMFWNNGNNAAADGFTIHALDEQAVVANLKSDSTTVLTWTQSGTHTFPGSFMDNGDDSRLQFVYQGGKDGKLTLHSIRTSLKASGSGMIVESGTLALAGTNTVHGQGSLNGRSSERYSHADDWHYADATSNVTVNNGAVFELDSHARLTGDIEVKSGGMFIMREGVKHDWEYIEGGEQLERTSAIASFHGLKGDVSLETGATLKLSTNSGTTAICSYNGVISGGGNVVVSHADTGSAYCLEGANTFTGSKTIERGGLIVEKLASLGNLNSSKWKVGTDGWIASHEGSVADLLSCLDSGSTGALALSADCEKLELSSHKGLHVGAETGKVINYGAVGTTEALEDVDGAWRFGGAGGELRVNYQLGGEADLLVHGAPDCTIVLNNENNDFTGTIKVQGALLQTKDLGNSVILENGQIHYTDTWEGQYSTSRISGTGTLGLKFTDDIDKNVLITDGDADVEICLLAGGVTLNQNELTRSLTLEDGTRIRMGKSISGTDGSRLIVAGKAELHGSDYSIASGVLCGAGELVNKSTGSVKIADMSNLASFTHDSAGNVTIEGGSVQSFTQKDGTVILAESVKADAITVNGGKLYINADKNNKQRITGAVTVDGGELCFSSAGTSDTLDYDAVSGVISVANGTLDFGTTRQTMGTWKLVLGDGACVTGDGDEINGAMDFNLTGSTIYATNGKSTISAVTRIRTSGLTGNSKNNLNFDVDKGATLTVSGCIQADAKSTERGQITKKGDGTLVLTERNCYDGGTSVSGGTLRTAELDYLGSGAVSVAAGARLEITAQSGAGEKTANISGSGTLALSFSKDSSLKVNLGGSFAGGLDISGAGTLNKSGEKSLQDNIRVSNGATLTFGGTDVLKHDIAAFYRKTMTVDGGVVDFGSTRQTIGTWDIALSNGAELKGSGESGLGALDYNIPDPTIYATSGENTISAVTRLRATNGNINLNYDVGKEASLTVTGLIHADNNTLNRGSITKKGAGLLVLTGANTYAGFTSVEEGELRINSLSALGSSSIEVNEGAVLRIDSEKGMEGFVCDRISGNGTVALRLSSAYGNTLSLGDSFQGETYVSGGNMTLNGASAGHTLRLAEGANLQFKGSESAAWDGNLVLEGTSLMHAASGADFTMNGSISGNGTYVSRGSGAVHFNGDVKLNRFEQTAADAAATVSFNGTTEMNTMIVSKGIVHINAKSELGSMTLAGGTVQIADEVKLNGDSRVDIRTGGHLLLADGAVLDRTNQVSSWIRGSLEVQKDAAARFVSVDDVHVSYDNAGNNGTIYLAENSSLELDVKGLYFYSGNSVQLESGSDLRLMNSYASFSNKGEDTASLIAANVGEKTGQQYSLNNANFELTGGHLKTTTDADVSMSNRLTRSSLEHAGGGTLTVNNGANTITSLEATGGDVKLAADMAVQSLSAAKGKSVSVAAGKSIAMDGGVSLSAPGADAALTAVSNDAKAGLQNSESFVLQGMELMNAILTVDADSATTVEMQNVQLCQVVLNQGSFLLRTAPPSVTLAGSGTPTLCYTVGISDITNGATLTLVPDFGEHMTGAMGVVDIEFVLEGFHTDHAYAVGTLAGLKEAYGIELGGMLGELLHPSAGADGENGSLSLLGSSSMSSSHTYSVSYGAGTGDNSGNLVISISAVNVPEPVTSTLGLLSLAAFAARRRRR
ncbi:MAG: autotransporter-associated beta strand repeat-containing protein [Akkermansia sp.]|nr:autotransporter-associated beta strand repeat-containing protein [Akkermansia sp.]